MHTRIRTTRKNAPCLPSPVQKLNLKSKQTSPCCTSEDKARRYLWSFWMKSREFIQFLIVFKQIARDSRPATVQHDHQQEAMSCCLHVYAVSFRFFIVSFTWRYCLSNNAPRTVSTDDYIGVKHLPIFQSNPRGICFDRSHECIERK